MNEGASPTMDDGFVAIVEKLARRHQYTPEPTIKGVCGFSVPSGLLATLQYRCRCGSIRCKVLAVVVGAGLVHQPVHCLKCGADDLTFERLDIGAV